MVQIWFSLGLLGAEAFQIWFRFWFRLGSAGGPRFPRSGTHWTDDVFPNTASMRHFVFLVVGFSVGVTHRPWTWPTHVAIAYVGSEFSPSLDTPATGEDALALPMHRPRAWRSQAVLLARPCHAMATSTWKTLMVESGGLKVLMILRIPPCGSMHVSVDPFHDYVRPQMPLGRWSSKIRFGSDLGQWWLCAMILLQLGLAHRWFLRT